MSGDLLFAFPSVQTVEQSVQYKRPMSHKRKGSFTSSTSSPSSHPSHPSHPSIVCTTLKKPKRNLKYPFGNILFDTLLHILSWLDQADISRVRIVNKWWREIARESYHLTYYVVYNRFSTYYAQKQINLQALAINGTKDLQLFFHTLPEYVFIGHYSSFFPHNTYSGLTIPEAPTIFVYPNVKVLFIEEAPFKINWEIFPNLEELYISTSQPDINLDTLDKCTKLRKVVAKIKQGVIYIGNPKVTELPKLEVLAISGTLSSGSHFVTTSPHLRTCIFYSNPVEYLEGCFYENHYGFHHVENVHEDLNGVDGVDGIVDEGIDDEFPYDPYIENNVEDFKEVVKDELHTELQEEMKRLSIQRNQARFNQAWNSESPQISEDDSEESEEEDENVIRSEPIHQNTSVVEDDWDLFATLFRNHHQPPTIITRSINNTNF